MTDRTPNLADLSHALEMRWRIVRLADVAVTALAVSLGASMIGLLARIVFDLSFPIFRLLLVVNGAALVASIIVVAVRRRETAGFFIDADRAYGLKSLLVSGYEYSQPTETADAGNAGEPTGRRESRDPQREAFERVVIDAAERKTEEIDPRHVYPARTPPHIGIVAALVVALGILLILQGSGWFDRPTPPYLEEALLLEDAGRRLAERAEDNEELQQLADEIRRLGEQVQRDAMPADEARRRIDQLNERIEEQIRNLERMPPTEYNEDADVPPETEDTIRRALRSGMSEGEVTEFFTRMRSEGNTVPDVVEALEEATPDRAPDTNLGLSDEEIQRLMDQINRPPPAEDAESDLTNRLEESQQALQQMGSGLAELTEGEEQQSGSAEESGVGVGGGREGESPSEEGEPETEESEGQESAGQQGGTMAVQDQAGDDFQPGDDTSPVFREIEGVVTENTIMDVIIRELPSEATSELTEHERDVIFERVIEEAVNREETPPELRQLVRNYFLRLTMRDREGAADEQ
jgi:hypothetical protein